MRHAQRVQRARAMVKAGRPDDEVVAQLRLLGSTVRAIRWELEHGIKPSTFAMDTVGHVLEAVLAGGTVEKIAKALGRSESTIRSIWWHYRMPGSPGPRKVETGKGRDRRDGPVTQLELDEVLARARGDRGGAARARKGRRGPRTG